MVFLEITALVSGYLIGSIPTAYIVTRIVRGKDIRDLGGGNIGALNTFKSVGWIPGTVVIIVDIGKGAAAVAIAHWWLAVSPFFVMSAGLLAVAGHLWMIFLKFSGGRGRGGAVGAAVGRLIIYSNWSGVGVF